MLGYLASSWSCPKCDAPMSAVPNRAGSWHCTTCREAFNLQFGHLLAIDMNGPDIDLSDITIDLRSADLERPIETTL